MTIIHNVHTFSSWFALSFRYHSNTLTGSLRGSEHCFPASIVPMPEMFFTTCSLPIDDVRHYSSFFPTMQFTETACLVGWLPQTGYKELPPLCHSQKWTVWLVGVCCHKQETISNPLNNTMIASLILQLDKSINFSIKLKVFLLVILP